jgi:ribosomal protein S18 acetylase RimI-like enzyme
VDDLQIREATIDDHPALDALWIEGDLMHHEAWPNVFARPAGIARSPDDVMAMLNNPEQCLIVAGSDDRIAGFVRVTLRDRRPPFVPIRFAIVEEIVVAAERRGEGIGSRLMAEAEAWAKNNGAVEVWLDVWEFNENAIGFYASLGYETITLRMRKELAL